MLSPQSLPCRVVRRSAAGWNEITKQKNTRAQIGDKPLVETAVHLSVCRAQQEKNKLNRNIKHICVLLDIGYQLGVDGCLVRESHLCMELVQTGYNPYPLSRFERVEANGAALGLYDTVRRRLPGQYETGSAESTALRG